MNRKTRKKPIRKYRYRVTAGACVLSVLAGNLTPAGTYLQEFLGEKTPKAMASTQIAENAVLVDFSKLDIVEQKLTYRISENGTYYFTGNNVRNETLIPAQILVDEGVEAEIYFDGLSIKNTDGVYNSHASFDGTCPFVIGGTVSLHVLKESSLVAHANAYGAIYIKETGHLICEEGEKLSLKGTGSSTYGIHLTGALTINGGTLDISSNFYSGIYCNTQSSATANIYIHGGNTTVSGNFNSQSTFVTGGNLYLNDLSTPLKYSNESTEYSKKVNLTLSDVPNAKIISAVMYNEKNPNGVLYGVKDVSLNDEGKAFFYVPSSVTSINMLVETADGNQSYHVDLTTNDVAIEKMNTLPKEMTYLIYENDSLVDSITGYIYSEETVALPNSHEYEYTNFIDNNGNSFDGTSITAGDSIKAYRQKKQFSITFVDETENEISKTMVSYGENLENINFPVATEGVYIFNVSSSCLVNKKSPILANTTITANQAYTLHFVDENGNAAVDSNNEPIPSQVIKKGDTYTLPNLDDMVYTYHFYDAKGTALDSTITVTEDMDIVTKKIYEEYTVTYNKIVDGELVEIETVGGYHYGDTLKDSEVGYTWIPQMTYSDLFFLSSNTNTVKGNMSVISIPVETDGTECYYAIRSMTDWEEFETYIRSFNLYNFNVKLFTDIDTSTQGTWTPLLIFTGNFDGQGHSIYYEQTQDNLSTLDMSTYGLFSIIIGSIKNLHLSGTISLENMEQDFYVGSFASMAINAELVHCSSDVSISVSFSTDSYKAHIGGIIGTTNNGITLTDCLYTGAISKTDELGMTYCGGFIGAADFDSYYSNSLEVKNSISLPSIQINGEADLENFVETGDSLNTTETYDRYNLLQIENCYYLENIGSYNQGTQTTEEELKNGELVRKLNTKNGTSANSHLWEQGKDYPILHHSHCFDQKVVREEYLAKAATSTEQALYYYSCLCGDKGDTTFSTGELLPSPSQKPSSSGTVNHIPDTSGSSKKDTDTTCKISGATYKITNTTEKTITYLAPTKKNKTTIVIPNMVTINGVKYKVTAIEKKAFYNNKKLKKITIGKNIKSIGAKAFYGCKKLKKMTIKTTLLKKKKVGKQAFANMNKKVKITMPKKCKKSYKKILKARGLK